MDYSHNSDIIYYISTKMININIIISFIGIILIMNGYHSIDLSYNYQDLSDIDNTLGNKYIPIDQIYRNGIIQSFIGIIFLCYGVSGNETIKFK